MALRIRWIDDTVMTGYNWQALFERLRRAQWYQRNDEEFRQDMAWRARVWSGQDIRTDDGYRVFFKDLERAGFLSILEGNKDEEPPAPLKFPLARVLGSARQHKE